LVLIALAAVAVLHSGCSQVPRPQAAQNAASSATRDATLATAFRDHQSGVQVTGAGTVTRVLSDDNDGGRHQRFILTLASGRTLLVAHNIDIAPRLPSLKVGDKVEFSGIYEWNPQGGVVHWTHRDPSGKHQAGWLRYAGRTYQ
jgi:hypothetical protein